MARFYTQILRTNDLLNMFLKVPNDHIWTNNPVFEVKEMIIMEDIRLEMGNA